MKLGGRVHKFGDHIDTDVIIPATLLLKTDQESLARGCFSAVYPGFSERVKPGDLLFAGENFGCGSSREHAPLAIKAAGIACCVAASFSRIFYRSAINIGLPIAICPLAASTAQDGDEAVVDFAAGTVSVGDRVFEFPAFPPEIVAILSSGGLVGFMEKRLKSEAAAQSAQQPGSSI